MDWTRICRLADIAPGATRAVVVDGERVLVCRVDDSRVFAIEDACTHDDAPLDQAVLEDCAIECPRHGARFDVTTGAVLRMPAASPLPTWPVRVTDGWVEIALEG
ncbi:MAG: Rieske (2Fe-2S) protein [Candidatus Krumholzibacteriia bacterium]